MVLAVRLPTIPAIARRWKIAPWIPPTTVHTIFASFADLHLVLVCRIHVWPLVRQCAPQYVAAGASRRLPARCQSLTVINPSLIREGLLACRCECVRCARSDFCVGLNVPMRASHTHITHTHITHTHIIHTHNAHTTIPSCKHGACPTIYRALATPNRR